MDDASPRLDDFAAEEVRVLGCLIEKEATVPDSYPLTLNSLRTACNQSTSRHPVVSYDDNTVERALARLRERGLTRTVHSTSNRATKYRHVVADVLGLEPAETAVLCVLMLRGPQTAGELKNRAERQHAFESLDETAAALDSLADRGLALQLERGPGQKDARWVHLLSPVDGGATDGGPSAEVAAAAESAHLTTVFDHDRLRIELGPRPDDHDGDVDLRVTVGAEQFGGTVDAILLPSDLERFVADLDDPAATACRLGGGREVLVELNGELANGVGPALNVECTIVCTEDDPKEWLQFLMFGVPPFAADTAARVRAVLAASGTNAGSYVPGARAG